MLYLTLLVHFVSVERRLKNNNVCHSRGGFEELLPLSPNVILNASKYRKQRYIYP